MWIAAVGRNKGGKLELVAQSTEGEAQFVSIADLRGELPFKRTKSRRVALRFDEYRAFPTERYLAAVEASTLNSTGQRCYEFETDEGPVIVPGQLLIVALVGATTLMRAPLFSPQGPTALMTAFLDDTSGKVCVDSTPKRMRRFQADRLTAVCRMAWILQFPTAARAWSSVYGHAVEGKLDITLPAASATAIVRGVEVTGKLMVTGMELLTLQATEEPHEFAQDTVRHSHVWTLTGGDRPIDEQIGVSSVTPLSTLQFQELAERSAILKKMISNKSRTYPVAEKIHLIRVHLKSGLPLFMQPAKGELLRATKVWIDRLIKAGQWDEIEAAIRATI